MVDSESRITFTLSDAAAASKETKEISRRKSIRALKIYLDAGAITVSTANTEVSTILQGLEFKFKFSYGKRTVEWNLSGLELLAVALATFGKNGVKFGAGNFRDQSTTEIQNMDFFLKVPFSCPSAPGENLEISVENNGETYFNETAANFAIASSTLYIVPEYGTADVLIAESKTKDAAASKDEYKPIVSGDVIEETLILCMADRDALTAETTADSKNNFNTLFPAGQMTQLKVLVGSETIVDVDNVECEDYLIREDILREPAAHDSVNSLQNSGIYKVPIHRSYVGSYEVIATFATADISIVTLSLVTKDVQNAGAVTQPEVQVVPTVDVSGRVSVNTDTGAQKGTDTTGRFRPGIPGMRAPQKGGLQL